jgi:signal transduction histidine kinase
MRTAVLVQRWLRVAGTITWSVIGITFLLFFLDVPLATGLAWAAAYATFFAGFWLGTSPQAGSRPKHLCIALLLLQTAAAFLIAALPQKPVGFIFLTLVAAQMPGVLPRRAAIAWVLAQTAGMGAVYATIVAAWEAQAYVAVYLGFQALAYMVVHAALREAAARAELARTHALLAQSQRTAERVRIGQDLHDVLGHHLTAMCLNLETAAHLCEGRAKEHVVQAQELVRKLLDDVREVVGELRCASDGDLDAALRALAATLPRPAIWLDVAADVRTLADPQRARSLVRCAQEVMTNAARHSGAENLWLTVRRRDAGVELSARDDGRGARELRFGGGLTGMQRRLQELGGSLLVESALGRGFLVTAWLP